MKHMKRTLGLVCRRGAQETSEGSVQGLVGSWLLLRDSCGPRRPEESVTAAPCTSAVMDRHRVKQYIVANHPPESCTALLIPGPPRIEGGEANILCLWKDSHSFPAYLCDSSHDGKEPDLKKQPHRVPIQEALSPASLPGLEGTWPRQALGS